MDSLVPKWWAVEEKKGLGKWKREILGTSASST